MPQKDTSGIKENIVSTIKNNGPSLPAKIARETGMSMLFASAFLSELLSEKRLKITNMKVGSSPIYYLPGQEKQLEQFSKYLKEKEKEAFDLLQEKKFLRDDNQEPAIRVALRAIKDFAKYFTSREGGGYWRYFLVPEEEFNKRGGETNSQEKEKTESKEYNKQRVSGESGKTNENSEEQRESEDKKEHEKTKQEEQNSESTKPEKETQKSEEKEKSENKHDIFDTSSKTERTKKSSSKTKEKKEKPEFVKEVLEYLNKNNIKVKQEVSFKKKEYQAIIQVNSDIGPVDFFLLAKGKKKISTDDVIDVINEAKKQKLYGLLLYSDEIQNKAEEFAKDNSQTLKVKKIK